MCALSGHSLADPLSFLTKLNIESRWASPGTVGLAFQTTRIAIYVYLQCHSGVGPALQGATLFQSSLTSHVVLPSSLPHTTQQGRGISEVLGLTGLLEPQIDPWKPENRAQMPRPSSSVLGLRLTAPVPFSYFSVYLEIASPSSTPKVRRIVIHMSAGFARPHGPACHRIR